MESPKKRANYPRFDLFELFEQWMFRHEVLHNPVAGAHTTTDVKPRTMAQIEESEEAKQVILRAKIEALAAQTKPARIAAVFATIMLSILFLATDGIGWERTAIWCAAMFAAYAFRDWLVHYILERDLEARSAATGIALASAALGLVINAPAAFFMPYMSPTVSGMYVGFLVAWLALAVSIIGIHVPSYAVYVVIGMTYLSVGYWIQLPANLAIAGSFGAIAASILLISFSRRVASVFDESVLIRRERDALVDRLTLSVSQAKDAKNQQSRFLAATAHDLLQPVHTLMLLSGVLQDSRTDEERNEAVESIRSTTLTVESMFRGLLDLARLDQGAVIPSLTDVRLSMVFRSIEAGYASRCAEKGVDFVAECNEKVLVRADAMLLDRVVRNLVDNAVKFTNSGFIELKAAVKNDVVEICVKDSGIGIEEAQQAAIFDAFFRTTKSVNQGIQGIGLGLSVAKQMTELMEGKLELHSALNEGTTVILKLGEGGSARVPTSASTNEPDSELPERIVVIEDDIAARSALNLWLQNNGVQTVSVDSLENALKQMQVEGFTPQHALVDFHLGEGPNGVEVIRELQKRYPSMNATLVSGAFQEADIIASGIDFLEKPLRPEKLREAIKITME